MDQTDNQKHSKDHVYGIAGTLLVHGLLVLLFITIVFKTPIPPWPEEGGGGGGNGLEINLGTGDEGSEVNPSAQISMPSFVNEKITQPAIPQQQEEIKTKNTESNDVLTQDVEEAPALPSKPAPPTKKPIQKDIVKQPAQVQPVKQPTVNQNALFKKHASTNDGSGTKPGNQGREDGTIHSGNYGGTGSGKGTGNGTGTGSGTGSGSGSGTGSGTGGGVGSGVSYDLGGRGAKSLTKPIYNSPEQGTVVVSIKVNQEGKVTYASAGAKGTTISEIGLRQQAELAARRTIFAADPNAPDEQRGTITYKFIKSR